MEKTQIPRLDTSSPISAITPLRRNHSLIPALPLPHGIHTASPSLAQTQTLHTSPTRELALGSNVRNTSSYCVLLGEPGLRMGKPVGLVVVLVVGEWVKDRASGGESKRGRGGHGDMKRPLNKAAILVLVGPCEGERFETETDEIRGLFGVLTQPRLLVCWYSYKRYKRNNSSNRQPCANGQAICSEVE
ncbi:unnamed protein product [Boreogadus saida]